MSTKVTTIRGLTPEMHRELKVLAAKENISLAQLMINMFTEGIKKRKGASK